MRPSKARTYYLGLCLTYHDPALAIVGPDGCVLFAEAAERRLQSKRALNTPPDDPFHLPLLLQEHCADAREFVVACNWQATRPLHEHFARWLGWLSPRGILTNAGRRVHTWLEPYQIYHMQAAQHHVLESRLLNLARTLRRDFPDIPVRIRGYDHHLCHAALACYASPFDTAACAVIDSYGETGSMAFFDYRDGRLRPIARQRGPQSLGFYYMKLTELCGFDWLGGDEWKVMGLASYGRDDPEILTCLRDMMTVEGLELRTRYPVFFDRLRQLESRRRRPGQTAESVADLAHSGQHFFSDTVHCLLSHLHDRQGSPNLALAGGCALNSVCNGRILESTPFRTLYVPPAPADDGTALGAAWLAYREDHQGQVFEASHLSPYLGSAIPAKDIERFARYAGVPVRRLPGEGLIGAAAELLVKGKILGWMQGRAEFGPRALGNRSILADPRRADTGDRINREVKFREPFRPYAPAILGEHGPDWFLAYQESPYMERTLRFRPEARERVPAVVHVDGTGRPQTVNPEWNPRFHDLLARFHCQSGVPVLLNTSFNVMGKPIVHCMEDAFGVFLGSGMDALAVGDYLFTKPETMP